MKKWLLQNQFYWLGGLLGAVAGFLYWKYWGCTTGCAITGSPRNSTLYFAVIGMLLASLLKQQNKTAGK